MCSQAMSAKRTLLSAMHRERGQGEEKEREALEYNMGFKLSVVLRSIENQLQNINKIN